MRLLSHQRSGDEHRITFPTLLVGGGIAHDEGNSVAFKAAAVRRRDLSNIPGTARLYCVAVMASGQDFAKLIGPGEPVALADEVRAVLLAEKFAEFWLHSPCGRTRATIATL
jgi:hypothetical protein